jgi:hypothetical protein
MTASHHTSYKIRLATLCAGIILVVALAGCGGSSSGSSPTSAKTPSTATPGAAKSAAAKLRTVRVYASEPAPSPSATDLRARVEKGTLPSGTVKATVLSDENCEPDAQGISHCRNRVRLASGQTLTLRHPHDMNKVPCLAPGEKILLSRA